MKTPFFEKRGRLPWSMERCGSLSMFGDEYMGTQPFYLGLPFALKSKDNEQSLLCVFLVPLLLSSLLTASSWWCFLSYTAAMQDWEFNLKRGKSAMSFRKALRIVKSVSSTVLQTRRYGKVVYFLPTNEQVDCFRSLYCFWLCSSVRTAFGQIISTVSHALLTHWSMSCRKARAVRARTRWSSCRAFLLIRPEQCRKPALED